MGFFDQLFNRPNDPRDYKKSYDPLLAMVPLVGLPAVIAMQQRRAKQDQAQPDIMFSDPSTLDPMGQRVQQNMLSRSEGNITTPGFMAQTMLSQELGNESNANAGNAYDAAARRLGAAGQVQASDVLSTYGHKTKPTPWKPSEGGTDIENFKGPNGDVVAATTPSEKTALAKAGYKKAGVASGEDEIPWKVTPGVSLGMQGKPAMSYFKVKYNKDGTIKDISSLENQSITVGGASLVSKPDLSQATRDYTQALGSAQQSLNVVDGVLDIVDRNPSGGITGLSGAATSFVGAVSNLAEFGLGFADDQSKGVLQKYEKGILSFGRKFFPTGDEALVSSQIRELAYALARMNNMGTAGGGRGITDSDMEHALKQLGTMSKIEDFKAVLNYQRNKFLSNLKISKASFEATVKMGGGDINEAAPLDSMYQEITKPRNASGPRTFNIAAGGQLPPDLKVGDIVNGKTYKGGDVSSPNSWE